MKFSDWLEGLNIYQASSNVPGSNLKQQDITAFNSPAFKNKLSTVMDRFDAHLQQQNLGGVQWNFILFNLPTGPEHQTPGIIDRFPKNYPQGRGYGEAPFHWYHKKEQKRMVFDYIKANNIPTQGHITVVITTQAPEGAGKKPMTPWIFLHRAAHEILPERVSGYSRREAATMDRVRKILYQMARTSYPDPSTFKEPEDVGVYPTASTLMRVMKFFNIESTRNKEYASNMMSNYGTDFIRELLVAFLWYGYIPLTASGKQHETEVKEIERIFREQIMKLVGRVIALRD